MGSGEGITIPVELLEDGFKAGSERLKTAIKTFSRSVQTSMRSVTKAGTSVLSTIKKWGPALLGIGSAYSIISKATNAFLAQNQQLSSKLSSVWTSLGNVLAPIITQMVNWITTIVSYFLTFLRLLGVTSKSASELSKAGNAAAGGANALQKSLLGFDELNLLQDNSGGGGGGGGMAGLQDYEPPKWMEDLVNLLKKGEWDRAADMIIAGMDQLIHTFATKAYEFGSKIGYYLNGALRIISRVLDEVNWHELGQGVARLLNGVMDQINGEDIGKILVAKFTIAFKFLTGFLEDLDWGRLADILIDMFIGALDALARAIETADFEKIAAGIKTFFNRIWERKDEIAEVLGRFLKAVFEAGLEILRGFMVGESSPLMGIVLAFMIALKGIKLLAFAALVSKATGVLKNLIPALSGAASEAGAFGGALQKVLGGSGSTAAEATTAASGLGGVLSTLGPIAMVAFGMMFASSQSAEQQAQYVKEAFDGLGNSTSDMATAAQRLQTDIDGLSTDFENLSNNGSETSMVMEEMLVKQAALDQVLQQLAFSLGLTTEELMAQIEAAGGDITKIDALADSMNNSASAMDNNRDSITELSDSYAENMEEISNKSQDAADRVTSSTEQINETTTENTDAAARAAAENARQMNKDVTGDYKEMKKNANDEARDIHRTTISEFQTVANESHTWGYHSALNYASGIRAGIPAIRSAAAAAANAQSEYMGHSVPKKGPLSDDDEWGYHMVQNFVKGIRDSIPTVVSAVSDLAESAQFGSSVSNNGSGILEGLQNIAGNVTYARPAMAMGGLTPYSVNGGSAGYSSGVGSEINLADVVNSINSLKAYLSSSIDDKNSTISLNVYLDGRQLEAVVTRRQERALKAKGLA